RCQLDRVRRARLFAPTAEDAAREVDAKELRVASTAVIFGGLQRDAVCRACGRAQIAADATLTPVWVATQDDATAPAWRNLRHLIGILDRHPALEHVQKDDPHRLDRVPHRVFLRLGARQYDRTGREQV